MVTYLYNFGMIRMRVGFGAAVGAVLFASAAWLVIRVGLAARTPADAGAPTSPAAAGPAHGTPKLEASAA